MVGRKRTHQHDLIAVSVEVEDEGLPQCTGGLYGKDDLISLVVESLFLEVSPERIVEAFVGG